MSRVFWALFSVFAETGLFWSVLGLLGAYCRNSAKSKILQKTRLNRLFDFLATKCTLWRPRIRQNRVFSRGRFSNRPVYGDKLEHDLFGFVRKNRSDFSSFLGWEKVDFSILLALRMQVLGQNLRFCKHR